MSTDTTTEPATAPTVEPKVTQEKFDDAKQQLSDAIKKEKVPPLNVSDMEALLIQGDLEKMGPEGRMAFYRKRCDDLGLDYLTRPFDYIRVESQIIKGSYKTVLYANKNCAEQLNEIHSLSHVILDKRVDPDNSGVYQVWVRVRKPIWNKGMDTIIAYREIDELGAANIAGLGGEKLANAQMKAVTKGKRRATLSICGVGVLDETEVETIPGVKITEAQLDDLSTTFRPPTSSDAKATDVSQSTELTKTELTKT